MRKHRSNYMGTSFRDRGRIAGPGILYDHYDDESVLDSHIRTGRPIGISEREERAKREREESPVTTYYIEKAPGDAATSGTGAVEKIQVQDSTDSEKAQEVEKLERFIALYKEMYGLSHSDAGDMVIGVDMFDGVRIHVGHEWFFENITDYVRDTAYDQVYDYYRAEMCGVRLICLMGKEGGDV